MLTSLDQSGDIQRFSALGFSGYLTKPVRARELYACLDRVLASEAIEWHVHTQPMVTRNRLMGIEPQKPFRGYVLLVEDNPVNQKVAVRFLERLGCRVKVAIHGAAAVELCAAEAFDLILMDLQMPVMDGFTATAHIRQQQLGGKRTPIVALTANALTGQLEQCLAADMDGLVTKPLDDVRLREALSKFGLKVEPGSASVRTPVELALLRQISEGDSQFERELAQAFRASGESVLLALRQALATADRSAVARAAHELKGSSSNVHATLMRDAAELLENEAPTATSARLQDLAASLEQEYLRARDYLESNLPAVTSAA
jgi:two-component system, sensor histidine kinase and response regulator